MAVLLEAILTLALVIAAIKLGWLWTILFVLLYILAFSLKWTYLSKRTQVTPQFLAVLAFFLTSVLFLRWIFASALTDLAARNAVANNPALNFLLGDRSMVMLWALVVGLGITILLAAALLLPYGYVAGFNLYSQYENYAGHEREAASAAMSTLIGIGRGTWVVSKGQAEIHGASGSSLSRFGGPGVLIVQEGHAVILEVSGKLSRVVGRGVTWLKPFERISMVMPLQVRSEHIVLEYVRTADLVFLDEFEFWAYHKADTGPEDEQIPNGRYAYNPRILVEVIWSPGGGDWRSAVCSVAETVGRDVIGRYKLEQLIAISDQFRLKLKAELTEAINEITRKKMGIHVTTVDFGKIKIASGLESRLVELWVSQQQEEIAKSQSRIEVTRSRAQAQSLEALEGARALAQGQMIKAIASGLGSAPENTDALVRLRFLEALEKIAQDPAMKILFPHGISPLDAQGLIEPRRSNDDGTAEETKA